MRKSNTKQSGFGLVEVIVSITIMTMVVIALTYVSRSAFYSWENANNKVKAYNLIQQEIEKIHNIRDSNTYTQGNDWDTDLSDYTNTIKIDSRDFNEKITITDIPVSQGANLKKKVVVEITWQERLGERSLSAVTYLTDWKPRY